LIWIALHGWRSVRQKPSLNVVALFTFAVLMLDLLHIAAPLVTVSAVDVPDQWKLLEQTAPADPGFRVMTIPANVDWQAAAAYTHHLNADGYDPLVGSAYQTLLAASDHNPTSPIARLLGVRYALTYQPFEWSKLPGADQLTQIKQSGDWYVYQLKNPLPRVFFAAQIQVAPDAQVLDQLRSGNIDPGVTVFVDKAINCPGGAPGTAQITRYMPDMVEIQADSPNGGLLILNDSYDTDWSTTEDTVHLPLIRVDTALRGLCLPAGVHTVRFDYQPHVFWNAVLISLTGWFLLVFAAVFGIMVKRRSLPNSLSHAAADEKHEAGRDPQ